METISHRGAADTESVRQSDIGTERVYVRTSLRLSFSLSLYLFISVFAAPLWLFMPMRSSLPPDSDIIYHHSLRKGRAGIRTTDEIPSHRDVEEDEELALEL